MKEGIATKANFSDIPFCGIGFLIYFFSVFSVISVVNNM